MSRPKSNKIKWLVERVPSGSLVDTPTLEAHGITRQLAHRYVESGWLEPVLRGLYRRPNSDLAEHDWRTVVHSLQSVMNYDSVVGGRTALSEQGLAHYLPINKTQQVHLYGANHPTWIKRLKAGAAYNLHTDKLFGGFADEETTSVDTAFGKIVCSTPERAIFELIDELPNNESFHIADTAFQSLSSARPRRFERLLQACRSIKVKRLFFVFADKHAHAWRRHLSPDQFDLGSGPRALVKDSRFHPIYKISVPDNLLPHGEPYNGA